MVGNNKIVLLINGMRVNPPGGEELMIRDDVSVRFAEQIEVVYGPGSTLYGQDAISAVINIKTRRPGETPGSRRWGPTATTTAGRASAACRLKLREQAETPLALTAFVQARESDLANLRKAYPVWYSNHQTVLAPRGITGDPVREDTGYNLFGRIESSSASLQAWFRDSGRSSAEGSGEGGMTPVLYFVEESKWRDRSLVVEGAAHAATGTVGGAALDPHLQPLRGASRDALRVSGQPDRCCSSTITNTAWAPARRWRRSSTGRWAVDPR